MNLKDIRKKLISAVPIIGSAIGGPAGGAVGALVASTLGVENKPKAIEQALTNDPEAFAKLQALELEHKSELSKMMLSAETTRIADVNATMRAEVSADKWWSSAWRPFWGAVSAIAFLLVVIQVGFLSYQAISGAKPEAMTMIPQIIGNFTMLFATPAAILGVASWKRGEEKIEKVRSLKNG